MKKLIKVSIILLSAVILTVGSAMAVGLSGDIMPSYLGFDLFIIGGASAIADQIFIGAGNLNAESQDFKVGAPVPEPASMLLLGAGLIGLAGYGRRKFKKNR